MSKPMILVIEDEEDIQELLRYNLERDGFSVKGCLTGEDGLKAISDVKPDLLLLDLMLPGIDGMEVCRTLRSEPATADLPIIMVTAKGEEADVVTGLELGADDYVTKPFSPRVLLARIQAVLRRHEQERPAADDIIRVANLTIDPRRHEVLVSGVAVTLTYTEFRLLQYLAGHPGWVFTRYQIVNAIRGEDYAVTDRAVDVQIVGLRRKLGESGHLIETVRGVGYRFKE